MNIVEIDKKEVKDIVDIINGKPEGIQVPVGVILWRLERNPASYVEYGAWWWAVKRVLAENGTNFGNNDDDRLRSEYIGLDDIQTLVLADYYRQAYMRHYFAGNRQFILSDGSEYTLYDPDMEMLVQMDY